ncbi:helix-turn-helix domain-containing protein [Halomarina oriensis]|uniref:Bacterio-opsin activator n=1 Tax=Halomarina oriensis TaxID=671145 RepID=A0A6B0GMT3_9EURY|nr:helix-turn-helix domain-containing protein [Halomarina oriensis]MWG33435.1 bacterio-opsin activator [Halomarina oriensis]
MATGIHVEMVVEGTDVCPVTSISEDCEVESIRTAGGDGGVIGELTVDRTAQNELESPGTDVVFADGSREVHRFTNDTADCPCGRIPNHGCPVRDLRAESGALHLSFIAAGVPTVRDVVTDVRARAESVRIRRLTRSAPDGEERLLFVDRDSFTDRQYETLETAHEMGYFETPRRSSRNDVADELDITGATFTEHLARAQRKLLDQILSA